MNVLLMTAWGCPTGAMPIASKCTSMRYADDIDAEHLKERVRSFDCYVVSPSRLTAIGWWVDSASYARGQ